MITGRKILVILSTTTKTIVQEVVINALSQVSSPASTTASLPSFRTIVRLRMIVAVRIAKILPRTIIRTTALIRTQTANILPELSLILVLSEWK